MAKFVMDECGLSERQACRTVNLHRCTYRYQAKKTEDHEIVQELRQLAESQPRWGCRKMTDYLRNYGHPWNHKRIRRVYRDLALNLHRKPKKRLAARTALALGVPVQSDLTWSLDFMSDSLSNGRAIRTLNIVDDYSGSKSIPHCQRNVWCVCWKVFCSGELLPNKFAWTTARS